MKEWDLNIVISHLVALITLDIAGGYTTAHYNITTHTYICLFPQTNMTMCFCHLSLQRHDLVQVILRFYKRDFDHIDIHKINLDKKKVQGLEVRRALFPFWLCCCQVCDLESSLASLGLKLFICRVWVINLYVIPLC